MRDRDVIKRELSFQTRRQTSRNSSGVLRKTIFLRQHTSPSILKLKWTLHMKKFLFNHCEVRVDLARVSPPRDTRLQNGRSVVANRAPVLFGCCGARSQL